MATISHEAFAQLAKWQKTLGAGPEGSHAVFGSGRVRLASGIVGVEAPVAGIDGVAVSADLLFGPALSVASEVTLGKKGERVTMAAGAFRASLLTIAGDTLPQWPALSAESAEWISVSEEWWKAVLAVAFAAPDRVGVRPVLEGVAWRGKVMVAGDGVRVARAAAPAAPVGGFLPTRLIVTAQASPVSPEAVAWVESRVWLRFPDGTLVWAGLPVEEWPDMVLVAAAEISRDAGKEPWAMWEEGALDAAAERLALFATEQINFRGQGKRVIFATKSSFGEAVEAVPAQVAREYDVSIGPKLLVDAVHRASSVAIAIDRGAAVFRRPGFELLVMLMVQA